MNLYFSENIKRLRKECDLTQETLADFLGVSFQAVSKWERGESYPDEDIDIYLDTSVCRQMTNHMLNNYPLSDEFKATPEFCEILNIMHITCFG